MITITVSVVCLGCVEFGGMIGYQPRSGGRAETGDELIAELPQTIPQTLLTGSRALNILFYYPLK